MLLQEPNIDQSKITAKVDDVNQLWDDLNELSHARQDALSGAKLVHVFDRNADETVTWITEKETILYSEDYGQDLEAVQALLRKHAGFDHDLAAVKEQVKQNFQLIPLKLIWFYRIDWIINRASFFFLIQRLENKSK